MSSGDRIINTTRADKQPEYGSVLKVPQNATRYAIRRPCTAQHNAQLERENEDELFLF